MSSPITNLKDVAADQANWFWFGQAGHFSAADKCQYHLHTHVGGDATKPHLYCVSTVGEYRLQDNHSYFTPPGASDHLYETIVFRLDSGGRCIEKGHRELTVCRSYTREEADAAHLELCREYASKGGK